MVVASKYSRSGRPAPYESISTTGRSWAVVTFCAAYMAVPGAPVVSAADERLGSQLGGAGEAQRRARVERRLGGGRLPIGGVADLGAADRAAQRHRHLPLEGAAGHGEGDVADQVVCRGRCGIGGRAPARSSVTGWAAWAAMTGSASAGGEDTTSRPATNTAAAAIPAARNAETGRPVLRVVMRTMPPVLIGWERSIPAAPSAGWRGNGGVASVATARLEGPGAGPRDRWRTSRCVPAWFRAATACGRPARGPSWSWSRLPRCRAAAVRGRRPARLSPVSMVTRLAVAGSSRVERR